MMEPNNLELQKINRASAVLVEDAETPSPIRRSNRVANKIEEVENVKKQLLRNNEFDVKFSPSKHVIKTNVPVLEQKTKPVIIVNDTRAQLEFASRQYKPDISGEKQNLMSMVSPKLTFSPKKNVPPNCITPKYAKSSNFSYKKSHTMTTHAQNKKLNLFPTIYTKASISNSSPSVLPSLTDDMYVMEAPSFIIPYVYEKPPTKSLKDFLNAISKNIEKAKTQELEECLLKKLGGKRKLDEKGTEPNWIIKNEGSPVKKTQVENDNKFETENIIKITNISLETTKYDYVPIEKKPMLKLDSPFDTTLGKFFLNIGGNLVQEFVQRDLLGGEKVKLKKERKKVRNNDKEILLTIASLQKNIELSEKANTGFNFKMKTCNICSFRTESALVLEHHKETPHMKMDIFKCNFCLFEIKSPHGILYHVETVHRITARLERAPAPYQCPNCFFEENLKYKTVRHLMNCSKRFVPQFNLKPGLDWDFPAKIPSRIPLKNHMGSLYRGQFSPPVVGTTVNRSPNFSLPKIPLAISNQSRQSLGNVFNPPILQKVPDFIKKPIARVAPQGLISEKVKIGQGQGAKARADQAKALAKQTKASSDQLKAKADQANSSTNQPHTESVLFPLKIPGDVNSKLCQAPLTNSSERDVTMMCEICDSHLTNIHQLRFHMKIFHKISLNERISALRPPLNCQKCTSRFFTDQGLERHLLGSHGLITPAMEQAAQNKMDSGRCSICGKIFQWKLVAHVRNDHNKVLKPAHLSYRCTVCSKLFPLYKEFEIHVLKSHNPYILSKEVVTKTQYIGEVVVKKLNLGDDVSLTKL